MKRDTADHRATPEADERLDRLVDAALHVSGQPRATVKARVMEAWDERHATGSRARGSVTRWGPFPPVLRPVAALAGPLVIALGALLAWQQLNRDFDAADVHRSARSAQTEPAGPASSAAPVDQRPEAASGAAPLETVASSASPRPRRPRYITVEWPVEQVADLGPHLPGAPAGELGDPVAPMPGPAPITIAPIQAAPSISDIARPVTEFPADTQPPGGGEGADAGKSGGPRR